MVYIAKEHHEFPPDDEPTTQITGDGNVVVFEDIGLEIMSDKKYLWRVDCVEGATKKRRQSDKWAFTMTSNI